MGNPALIPLGGGSLEVGWVGKHVAADSLIVEIRLTYKLPHLASNMFQWMNLWSWPPSIGSMDQAIEWQLSSCTVKDASLTQGKPLVHMLMPTSLPKDGPGLLRHSDCFPLIYPPSYLISCQIVEAEVLGHSHIVPTLESTRIMNFAYIRLTRHTDLTDHWLLTLKGWLHEKTYQDWRSAHQMGALWISVREAWTASRGGTYSGCSSAMRTRSTDICCSKHLRIMINNTTISLNEGICKREWMKAGVGPQATLTICVALTKRALALSPEVLV